MFTAFSTKPQLLCAYPRWGNCIAHGASELAAVRRARAALAVDVFMCYRMCRMLWAVIKRFMDPSSAAKFQFLSGLASSLLVRLLALPRFSPPSFLAVLPSRSPPDMWCLTQQARGFEAAFPGLDARRLPFQ